MATDENKEYLALLQCKVELTSEISADPLSVSSALVAKGLIPESVYNSVLQLPKVNKEKASELVNQVTNKVKTFPEKLKVFLEVLSSFIWLKDVVELVQKKVDDTETKISLSSPSSQPTASVRRFDNQTFSK